MALIVQKYGGTSVGNTARLKNVAARVPTRKLAGRLFRQKRARRRALAALSFPEKISVLVQLQQMASDIRKVCGRKQQRPWNLGR